MGHLVPITPTWLAPVLPAIRRAALERIPVEVWQKILSIAISCPLLPQEDDDYFQRREIVEVGCTKIFEYIKSERIRANLRLVCHAWDDFLDQHSDRLVYLSPALPLGHWPTVRKWERVVRVVGPGHFSCKCKQGCSLSGRFKANIGMVWHDLSLESNSVEDQTRQMYLPMLGDRCKVVAWPSSYREDFLGSKKLGYVTMLCDDLTAQPSMISAISESYRRLTYLNVILPSLLNPSLHLDLPQLIYLSLSITWTRRAVIEIPTRPVDIGRWELPALRCITFGGTVPARAIYILLEQVGRNVTECHIMPVSVGWTSPYDLVSNQIWLFLPSVRLLGISFTELVPLSPPTDHGGPPIHIMIHFDNSVRMFILPEDQVIARFQISWTSETFGGMTIDVSWIDLLQSVIDCPEWSDGDVVETELKAFEILNGIGNGLRDREGVLFDKNLKEQLWEAVEKHEYIRRNFRRQRDPVLNLDLRDFIV